MCKASTKFKILAKLSERHNFKQNKIAKILEKVIEQLGNGLA